MFSGARKRVHWEQMGKYALSMQREFRASYSASRGSYVEFYVRERETIFISIIEMT